MDKTYAAVTGNITTDWLRVIARLNTLSHEELEHYTLLAGMWPTCAVGNQCAIIPRSQPDAELNLKGGAPLDEILSNEGSVFPLFISSRDQKGAKRCWDAIEARSAVLIREELAKLNP